MIRATDPGGPGVIGPVLSTRLEAAAAVLGFLGRADGDGELALVLVAAGVLGVAKTPRCRFDQSVGATALDILVHAY